MNLDGQLTGGGKDKGLKGGGEKRERGKEGKGREEKGRERERRKGEREIKRKKREKKNIVFSQFSHFTLLILSSLFLFVFVCLSHVVGVCVSVCV